MNTKQEVDLRFGNGPEGGLPLKLKIHSCLDIFIDLFMFIFIFIHSCLNIFIDLFMFIFTFIHSCLNIFIDEKLMDKFAAA